MTGALWWRACHPGIAFVMDYNLLIHVVISFNTSGANVSSILTHSSGLPVLAC